MSMETAAGTIAIPYRSLGEAVHMIEPRRGPTMLMGRDMKEMMILDLIWSPSPMDFNTMSDEAESENIQRSMMK